MKDTQFCLKLTYMYYNEEKFFFQMMINAISGAILDTQDKCAGEAHLCTGLSENLNDSKMNRILSIIVHWELCTDKKIKEDSSSWNKVCLLP